jgi:hypothetical protein
MNNLLAICLGERFLASLSSLIFFITCSLVILQQRKNFYFELPNILFYFVLMTKETQKCPLCHGVGEIEKAGNNIAARQRRKKSIAHALRKEGYTIREIAALMGYKSPSQVHGLLNSK